MARNRQSGGSLRGRIGSSRSDRAGRFFARLDGFLPTIPDLATRRAFLDRQIDGWEHRYARFLQSEGASEPEAEPTDPPQAADFLLTIIGLAARRSALGHFERKDDHAGEE
jgi:aminoglycoside phosphotransferase (APT) family kinase protein